MNLKYCAVGAAAMIAFGFAQAANAAAVIIPYTGSFSESSSGDIDGVAGAGDLPLFQLVSGANTFAASAQSNTDPSDAFLIEILPGFTLVSASIQWATNASDFNPVFANPAPKWTVTTSDGLQTVLDVTLTSNGATATVNFNVPNINRGPGIYSVVLGNGLFALSQNNAPINYTMTFNVRQDLAAVPLPAALPLFLAGLGALGVARRRKKA
jgi:hypothetical protein